MSHLDVVPVETIEQHVKQAYETAINVFNCATHNQSFVYTIHGPNSEHQNHEQFPHINNMNVSKGQDFHIKKSESVHINLMNSACSIILSGLHSNTIIIHTKVNHIIARRGNDIHLDIKQGTMSGVDIIHCKRMLIKMPYHNYTNLEYGEGIYFQAAVNDISQLHITGSLDVKVNGISIQINPFLNAILTKDGWSCKKISEIP